MKKILKLPFIILLVFSMFSGCTKDISTETADIPNQTNISNIEEFIDEADQPELPTNEENQGAFDVKNIPDFTGEPYVEINNNKPYFNETELTTHSFEKYSTLDKFGRCGVAYANIGIDIMPTEERGKIGMIKPSGWHTVKYDFVDGKYLYNRCHLIGYQLSAENANEKNLITGTRFLNVVGMLQFENMVADYVKETHNHVLYRSTPIFEGDNLLAYGVQIEGLSVEDNGKGVCFNVFCYNCQPGIIIDYSTGESFIDNHEAPPSSTEENNIQNSSYIGNKNTKKFHIPSCSSVNQMKEKNKEYMNCSREEAISRGYSPCQNCNP